MKFITKSAFTLIELLVVITIIGILATGATTVYTSQIQKARDSVRISDIKALQSAIEQVYQDSAEYPASNTFASWTTLQTWVADYMDKIPSDPKDLQPCNGQTICTYIYGVGPDDNGILGGEYEVSTGFENEANRTTKASVAGDNWNDNLRLEVGIDVWDTTNHLTEVTWLTSRQNHVGCTTPVTGSLGATSSIYINSDCNQ